MASRSQGVWSLGLDDQWVHSWIPKDTKNLFLHSMIIDNVKSYYHRITKFQIVMSIVVRGTINITSHHIAITDNRVTKCNN